MEISFENFGASSFLSESSQTWQSYSFDTSSMIVDIGYETVSFRCISSSYLVPSTSVQLYYGGQHVDQYLYQLLLKEFPELVHTLNVSTCELWKIEYCKNPKATKQTFNGKEYDISKALEHCGDIFFDPTLLGLNEPSIPSKMISVRQALDIQTRVDIKVAIFGGGATLPGLADRIHKELTLQKHKCNFHKMNNEERIEGCWVGGSVMGSLTYCFGPSPFVTKVEYAEHGSAIALQKFVN
jgi:actin-related protein